MSFLESAFPGLLGSGYVVTSPPTGTYNCIAWAAGDTERRWWPDPVGVSFWPQGISREETLPAFLAAFAALGYQPTTDPAPQDGLVKVAIYARSGLPTHAARQRPHGRWTSKLGGDVDIEHSLSDLCGTLYGDVAVILARPQE